MQDKNRQRTPAARTKTPHEPVQPRREALLREASLEAVPNLARDLGIRSFCEVHDRKRLLMLTDHDGKSQAVIERMRDNTVQSSLFIGEKRNETEYIENFCRCALDDFQERWRNRRLQN